MFLTSLANHMLMVLIGDPTSTTNCTGNGHWKPYGGTSLDSGCKTLLVYYLLAVPIAA